MIFLPNIFERYTAALRNSIQISAIKYGYRQKHFDNMRKIFTAEAKFCRHNKIPVDLGEFTARLLTALYINRLKSDLPFEFSVNIRGNYMVNQKLFVAFLLTACKYCHRVEAYEQKGRVIIKVYGLPDVKTRALAKMMNALIFYEIKTQSVTAIFPFTATDKKQTDSLLNIFDLQNPFSAINIFWNSSF